MHSSEPSFNFFVEITKTIFASETKNSSSSPEVSPSISSSLSVTTSPSKSITVTATASTSLTVSPTQSITATPSQSLTVSPTATQSPISLSQLIESLNDIPLTNFTNDVITSILDVVSVQSETISEERVQPPFDKIAAGFFATNPDAESVTITSGTITLTLAKLDASQTSTFGSEEAPIIIPPLPVPADAIVYISQAILPQSELSRFNLSSNSTSIGVTSLTGAEYEIKNLANPITVGFASVENFNKTEQECSYWSTTENKWATDGCTLVVDAQNNPACECTHLTEFALRFRAIADIQAGIINSLSKLLTLEGLKAAAPILGLLGGLAAAVLATLYTLTVLDRNAAKRFAEKLDNSPYFIELRSLLQLPQSDSWDSLTRRSLTQSPSPQPNVGGEVTTFPNSIRELLASWIKRSLYFHPWLSIIFRFEPGMPRIFRALFIVASFITTISVSILFYGYKHADTDAKLELSETIVLSLMTTAVSIPLTKIMMFLMQTAGKYEFRARYGHLATEIIKRTQFLSILHKLPSEHLHNELTIIEQRLNHELYNRAEEWIAVQTDSENTTTTTATATATASTAAAVSSTLNDNFEEMAGISILYSIFGPLCSRNHEKLRALFRKNLNHFTTRIGSTKIFVSRFNHLIVKRWPSFPLHTNLSALTLTVLCGWVAWCCTYILGFTSFKSSSTTLTIFETVTYSLITSHLITQPLVQLVLLLVEYYKQKKRAPEELNYNYLQELTYKVFTEFVGDCSICPWLPHEDLRRAALVCPNSMLLKKIMPPSSDAQIIEDKARYIYELTVYN
jgi:hypothetical protein